VLASVAQGQDAVIVRPRFTWGRGDTTLLLRFVDAVRRGRFAWIGGRRALTSTCQVDNVVEGMLLAAGGGPALTRSGVRLVGEEVAVSDARPRQVLGYVGRVSVALRMAGLKPGAPGSARPARAA